MSSKVSIPFAEPPWLTGTPSAYYTDSHRKWQKTCREFINANFTGQAIEWQKAGHVPDSVFSKFAAAGFLIPLLPAPLPAKLLRECGFHELPGGLQLEEFDYIHYSIHTAEV